MSLLIIGLNHNTAPVALRERLYFAASAQPALLSVMMDLPGIDEAVVLSTCNRTEVIIRGEDTTPVVSFLARHAGMSEAELLPHLYQYAECTAMEHLFRVACGLDSQVLGETQILKQLRDALELARACEAAGSTLLAVLQQAIATGKRARSETAISLGSLSIGHAGVALVHSLFPRLHDSPVLILGAGTISELTARHLATHGVKTIFVANRTHAHAQQLAERLGGMAIQYGALEATLAEVDILISSTSAPHYVLHAEEIARVMHGRDQRPLCLIDLAVPRDIDPAAGELPGVHLYNIDDLRGASESTAEMRREEIPKVEAIIAADIARCRQRLAARDAAAVISALRLSCESLRQAELRRHAPLLAGMTPEQRAAVEAMTESLLNKVLHTPTVRLKELLASAPEQRPQMLLSELFDLAEDINQSGTPIS